MNEILQIKICGLTVPEQALQCAKMGADAIGLVFFAKSPRNVSDEQARAISDILPPEIVTTGVLVNENFDFIMNRVKNCGLKAVQLHGQETPELVEKLRAEGLTVIKGLFMSKAPFLQDAPDFAASGFLVECGKGKLPGGNAETWKWSEAGPFARKFPLILAGGLSPENVAQAISESEPDAVDVVSSGVEASPGQKDMEKVRRFIAAVQHCDTQRKLRRIF